MGSLIPSLPDDLGWQCLLRVELNSHHKLKCVSKTWNSALKSTHFYQQRKKLNISEQRICMLVERNGICNRIVIYDVGKNSCKNLPPIPTEVKGVCVFRCYLVKQKLVLIIMDCAPEPKNRYVWLYDFVSLEWREGAKMPKWLISFCSAVDEEGGLIYVAGDFSYFYNPQRIPIRSALVYNVEEDKWDILTDMNNDVSPRHYSLGAFAGGKFYVIQCSLRRLQVYDPYTKTWTSMNIRFSCGDSLSALRIKAVQLVSAFGRIYCLFHGRLIEYDCSQNSLNIVQTFPTEDCAHCICFAVAISNRIFVSDWDDIRGVGYFSLEPPSDRGGNFKLIRMERPSQDSVVSCAATLSL